MSNPVFENTAVFRDPQRSRQRGSSVRSGPATTAGYDAATLDQMYDAPAASNAQIGRMTYDDVIMKTAGLLAVVVATAAFAWFVVPDALRMPVAIGGALVGFVLGLVNAFKKNPSPALIVLYAAAEGLFLGGISWYVEVAANLPGIVTQAVLATMATFAACLVLFRSGKVRVTPKFTRWLLIAMGGYLIFSLVNLGMALFGAGGDGMFGPLRSGPLGMVVGLFAVGLAAAMLIVDFDSIKRGVEGGAPARMAWTAAFGLVVTLVWMYLEFLRLIAILRGSD
ncbi:Bax inhibitor-1/YccA family protein [Cellulomonas sp. ATA003]|uniref:Bax inhibitor-1/YccA family protein n=1 Tax=Cellulomonas sp. ATA003 TaxID=3073064 RepID=UPI0028732D0A|nr:Bax inhibitor-1/YccA family protein [Cellulomonas sp. ATA003]WNB85042.1 Bax inhibitor-1/YccA family protein [Cellulomonas sp. ATA003]